MPRFPSVLAPRAWRTAATCLIASSLALAFQARAGDLVFKIVDAGKQPVADAVIALYPLDAPIPPAAPPAPVVIEQRELKFNPYVTALRVGSSAVLPNNEDTKVEHQVFSGGGAKRFEFPLYKPGQSQTVLFDQAGLVVLGCNMHDFMLAYVTVLKTPWFAQTAANGEATVAGLAAGRWRAEIWHPRLKDAVKSGLEASVARPVTVAATGPATVENITLTLGPDRRIRRGPPVGGGGYK